MKECIQGRGCREHVRTTLGQSECIRMRGHIRHLCSAICLAEPRDSTQIRILSLDNPTCAFHKIRSPEIQESLTIHFMSLEGT